LQNILPRKKCPFKKNIVIDEILSLFLYVYRKIENMKNKLMLLLLAVGVSFSAIAQHDDPHHKMHHPHHPPPPPRHHHHPAPHPHDDHR